MYSSISLLGNFWEFNDFNEQQSLMLAQRHNISLLLAKLINIRNISDTEVENYLKPKLVNNIPDPFQLKDMKKSVVRLTEALLNQQIIGVIADYDVDGITSAAILYKFLASLNQKVILKIPNRLKDGYGPNNQLMNQLLEDKIDLLFTLDCGTNSFGVIDDKQYNYFDTIVIDHHISEIKLPKVFSIINPNRFDEDNNLNNLAAVGVTFLFILAMRKHLRENNFFNNKKINEPNLLSYLDLVALGTVCDVVSLQNYNRIFVSQGLDIIHRRTNKGIAKIIDNSRINHSPKVSDLSYVIGPQLNAASRIDDPTLSLKALISENIIEIESITRKLLIFNEKRKLIEKNMFEEALEQINFQKNNNIIIVEGEAWHKGVLGIVASKIVEKFFKPTVVISFDHKYGIGSARSINNIDLGKIILNAKHKGLLISGGGHHMAAGLKVSKDLFNEFKLYLINLFNGFKSSYFIKINYFDSILTLDEININLIDNIEKLEPFGNGNHEPIFIIENVNLEYTKIINDKHLLLNFKNNFEKNIKGISFNCLDNPLGENFLNNRSKNFNIVCTIKRDNYQNNLHPQLIVIDAILIN